MPPARVCELFSGWSAEGALKYPHQQRVLRDGKPFLEGKITKVELNPVIDDAIFAKPAK